MDFTFEVFQNSRKFLVYLLNEYNTETLNRIPVGFNNNIIWNIGHVLVTEQLLVYKLSGLPMLVSEDFIAAFKKGTKPERQIQKEEIDQIKVLLIQAIEKTKTDYLNNVFVNFQEYTVSTTGNTLKHVDDALTFALFHEGLHFGVVKSLLKALKL